MIKMILALLLIAGILLAAQIDAASANENRLRTGSRTQDWWQTNFGQYLSARSFGDVPWLNHVTGSAGRSELPIGPKLDTLEPFRLHFTDTPTQVTESGQFRTE